ncbi:hypothetical protein SGLAM104S_06270 [Streptomyces glaucescens]
MPSAPGRPRRERLPQGDPVRYDVDLDAVAAAQPFQHDVRVGLAQAPEHHLVGVLVLFQPHRRVLGDQPGQALGEFVLVGLAVRLDGERQQRVRHAPGFHQQRVVLGGEGVAGLRAAESRHAHQVARDGVRHRPLLFPERHGQRPDAFVHVVVLVAAVGEAVPGDVDGLVGAQRAGEDPHQGDPADVGVRGGLDDLRDQRAVGVARFQPARLAVDGGHGGHRVLEGGGEPAGDQLQQLDRADALAGALGGRRRGQHREERAPGHGPLQVIDQRLQVDLLAAQIAVHEGLVLALGDDPLDQPVAGLLDQRELVLARLGLLALPAGVVEELLGEQPDQPGHGRVPVRCLGAVQRQVQREHGVRVVAAEGLGADPGHLLEVGAGRLQVRDHDRAGHADGRALLPHHAGRAVHAVGGGDDEEGRVRRSQTGPQLPDEVGVSRGVEDVDLDAVPFDGHQRQLHRTLLAVLDVVVVGDGAAVLHAARPVHRSRGQRESFHQSRLARSGVADQHHIPYGRGVVGRRSPAGGSGVGVCLVAHDPASRAR